MSPVYPGATNRNIPNVCSMFSSKVKPSSSFSFLSIEEDLLRARFDFILFITIARARPYHRMAFKFPIFHLIHFTIYLASLLYFLYMVYSVFKLLKKRGKAPPLDLEVGIVVVDLESSKKFALEVIKKFLQSNRTAVEVCFGLSYIDQYIDILSREQKEEVYVAFHRHYVEYFQRYDSDPSILKDEQVVAMGVALLRTASLLVRHFELRYRFNVENSEHFLTTFPHSNDGYAVLSWCYFYHKIPIPNHMRLAKLIVEADRVCDEYWTLLATLAFENAAVAGLLVERDLLKKRIEYWTASESKRPYGLQKKRHHDCIRFLFNVIRALAHDNHPLMKGFPEGHFALPWPTEAKRVEYLSSLSENSCIVNHLQWTCSSDLSSKRVRKWSQMSLKLLRQQPAHSN